MDNSSFSSETRFLKTTHFIPAASCCSGSDELWEIPLYQSSRGATMEERRRARGGRSRERGPVTSLPQTGQQPFESRGETSRSA